MRSTTSRLLYRSSTTGSVNSSTRWVTNSSSSSMNINNSFINKRYRTTWTNAAMGRRPMNFLLPKESSYDIIKTSTIALFDTMINSTSRDKYLYYVSNDIIKHSVLSKSPQGSILILNLFANIQNPLFTQYYTVDTNIKEFLTTVGPALQVFHETLMKLGNELPSLLESESQSATVRKTTTDDTSIENDIEIDNDEKTDTDCFLYNSIALGSNLWRDEAAIENNTSITASLARQLQKITTPDAFDAFFYSAKAILLSSQHDNKNNITIVQDCTLGEIALLKARVQTIDTVNNEDTDDTKVDNNTSSSNINKKNNIERVAAQLDVLYEITHTFKKPIVEQEEEDFVVQYMNDNTDLDDETKKAVIKLNNQLIEQIKKEDAIDAIDTNTNTDNDTTTTNNTTNDKQKYETIVTTTLGVAVFEGWLSGSPDGQDLRWKVALIRDATEFPHEPSIVRMPSTSSTSSSTTPTESKTSSSTSSTTTTSTTSTTSTTTPTPKE